MMTSLGSHSWCKKRKRTGPNAIVPILGNQHQVDNADHSNCLGVESAPVIIDLDALDDDIAISSARAFAEAKNNTRRHHAQTVVIDLDSEGRSSSVAQTTCKNHISRELVNADPCSNLETSNCKSRLEKEKATTAKEPTFSCPVCLGPLVEEMTTRCGHIFCKNCIKMAIKERKVCPTCRNKITTRTVFRVYLPTITY